MHNPTLELHSYKPLILRDNQANQSDHLIALRRGLLFAAAAVALILPMAVATRHIEAELTLAQCWPLDLSAAAPRAMSFPAVRADDVR